MVESALRDARVESAAVERLGGYAAARPTPRLRAATAWAVSCLSVDASMLLLAAVATTLGGYAADIATPSAGWLALFAGLAVALYHRRGLYAHHLKLRTMDDVLSLAAATTLAAMTVVSLRVIVGDTSHLTAESLRPWAFALAYVTAGRVALYWSQTRAREHGDRARPTLIVGAGRIGTLTAKRLLDAPELGLRPVAFLDKDPLADTRRTLGLPVAGASWDLDEVIDRFRVEQVIITFSTAPEEVLLRVVRRCEERGIDVAIVPRLFERMPEHLTVEHLGGLPLITPRRSDPRDWHFDVKYLLDRVAAAAALLVLSPVLVPVALAVLVSMGRPILFRQLRVGRDGRMFAMLKLRSMLEPGGEAAGGTPAPPPGLAPGGVEGEDRRTRLGAFLRRTSIDELPQLINVLRGEMSLVGPRPERPEFVSRFERDVYRYGDRHRVKSGITGWAQVNGLRGKTSIEDRAEWDNFYIENFSLWLDAKIALLTFGALVRSFRSVE